MAEESILVVEDDADQAQLLAEELGETGYEVTTAPDAETGQRRLAEAEWALVLCDIRLPGATGLDLLEDALRLPEPPGFILITAFGSIQQAVEALKKGADDFLTKPLDLEHLRVRVERTLEHHRLRREIGAYRRGGHAPHFHDLVGQSEPMRRLYHRISRVAAAGGPVLIEGESGTGKELVARAVHEESPRAGGPFVPVNCAAIPAELMESELFGHEKGAFTGAARARKGLFAEAHGGSLFLDEIAEMPPSLQATLLRVLQDGRVRPVGAEGEREVDVRVITATNHDLAADVHSDAFREDLYYRLETFALHVPPLRERGDDLELLAGRFIADLSRDLGRPHTGLDGDALRCLRGYTFPGNVRELRNAMERAVAFAADDVIRCRDLPARMQSAAGAAGEGGGTDLLPHGLVSLEELERRYIAHVLEHTGGNKRSAAEILGVSRRTLYRHLERWGEGT